MLIYTPLNIKYCGLSALSCSNYGLWSLHSRTPCVTISASHPLPKRIIPSDLTVIVLVFIKCCTKNDCSEIVPVSPSTFMRSDGPQPRMQNERFCAFRTGCLLYEPHVLHAILTDFSMERLSIACFNSCQLMCQCLCEMSHV